MLWKRAEQVRQPGIYLLLDLEDPETEFPNIAVVRVDKMERTGKMVVHARAGFCSTLDHYIGEKDPQPHVFYGPITMPVVGNFEV